jgi:hypothetical protein
MAGLEMALDDHVKARDIDVDTSDRVTLAEVEWCHPIRRVDIWPV